MASSAARSGFAAAPPDRQRRRLRPLGLHQPGRHPRPPRGHSHHRQPDGERTGLRGSRGPRPRESDAGRGTASDPALRPFGLAARADSRAGERARRIQRTTRPAPGSAISSSAVCASSCAREIHAQFEKFRATGLPLDHVNGHLHLHLHPTVFRILMEDAGQLGIKRLRLTFDPFRLNLRAGLRPSGLSRAPRRHLSSAFRARPARAGAARHPAHRTPSSACCRTRAWTKTYVSRLLPQLPAGDSELYSHPSLDEFKNEFDALISPRVREQVKTARHQTDSLPGFVIWPNCF